MSKPLNEVWGLRNPVVMRASVALPAAGAWDAAPTEAVVSGIGHFSLYFQYTRGAAGGSFGFRMDASPYPVDQAVYQNWFRMALYEPSAVVLGADTASEIQREHIVYQPTGAAIETFVYGPVELRGTVERIRVACAEIGAVANPGTLAVLGMFV